MLNKLKHQGLHGMQPLMHFRIVIAELGCIVLLANRYARRSW